MGHPESLAGQYQNISMVNREVDRVYRNDKEVGEKVNKIKEEVDKIYRIDRG